jgi:hypothetical protein
VDSPLGNPPPLRQAVIGVVRMWRFATRNRPTEMQNSSVTLNMNVHQFLERPTKEAIRELPKFEGLPLQKNCLVRTADDLFFAYDEISKVSS